MYRYPYSSYKAGHVPLPLFPLREWVVTNYWLLTYVETFCDRLPTPRNGQIKYSVDNDTHLLVVGSSFTITCDVGYLPSNYSFVTCIDNETDSYADPHFDMPTPICGKLSIYNVTNFHSYDLLLLEL